MNRIYALAVFAAAAVGASAAVAQTMPPCAGRYEVVRLDTIKPGKMDLFKKAIADHQAWYVAHKLPDHILLGQILLPQGSPGGGGLSTTTAMTIHTDAAGPSAPPHDNDTAWKDYVAEYDASSEVQNTTIVCISSPK